MLDHVAASQGSFPVPEGSCLEEEAVSCCLAVAELIIGGTPGSLLPAPPQEGLGNLWAAALRVKWIKERV